MSTYKELVYMVLDQLKLISDDSLFTEDHVIFVLDKYRAFLLKLKYENIKKQIPESNFQTICLDLIKVPAISGEPCEGGEYLRSKEKVPFMMNIAAPKVYPTDYYLGDITYVTRDRMKYVGHNKFLQNIIYCSISPENYLFFKSSNPQHLYLEKVKVAGVFEDSITAAGLSCDENGETICDILDKPFPLEDSLISTVIELAVKVLTGAIYKPADEQNNAKDNLEDIYSFLARNVKSDLQKLISQ